MEFLGSCFSLPVSDKSIPIMDLALGIYKKWLGLSVGDAGRYVVPECLYNNVQFYYQEIIKQTSAIFERRGPASK